MTQFGVKMMCQSREAANGSVVRLRCSRVGRLLRIREADEMHCCFPRWGLRLALLAAVGTLPSSPGAAEWSFYRSVETYASAVEFCRRAVKRPMTVDLDRRVLCFDGEISRDLDFSPLGKLSPTGTFVVRSRGGDPYLAMELADFLRKWQVTVVVYDYCMSACASYLLVAGDETYVTRDTVVAWHHTTAPLCAVLQDALDRGPRRLEKVACPEAAPEYGAALLRRKQLEQTFFASRVLDPLFEDPPQSIPIRRILKSMFEQTATYPDVLWTWNPRYSAVAFKTKITYEAYPGSQDEVDALMARHGYGSRRVVLYDP